MKSKLAIALLFALPAFAHASKLADGAYTCDIDGSAILNIEVKADSVNLAVGNYVYTRDPKPIENDNYKGTYKADRYESSIIVAQDGESDTDRLVGTMVVNNTDGKVTLTSSVTQVSKEGQDFQARSWVWTCKP